MIITKKNIRKQIADLSMDLEIINPIESKTILAGGWYDNGYGITITYGGGGSSGGDYNYDSSGGSYSSDWNNIDGNNGNGGGGGASDPELDESAANGILEDPTATEIWWLLNNTDGDERDMMRNNRDVAMEYGAQLPGITNGQGDALRHAMWSAMNAADLGLDRAREFHTLHETAHPETNGSNEMDLHNNNWGFEWFQQHGNPTGQEYQFVVDFMNAMNNGQIQTQLQP